ncbi:MAG: aromatic aminobenezylarsenical efflux permease ArsG family transporter [Candidatus Zixiibacteriota bacterium]
MDSFWLAFGSAFWLGVLTSISPCPLATNIAAISFLGRKVGSSRQVLINGTAYTVGRMLAYLLLAVVVIAGILSIPGISNFLQKYMNKILGPLLFLVGLIVLDIIPLRLASLGAGEKSQKMAERGGVWGAAALGFLFALSLCPVSAALFFGSLIPLSVKNNSSVLLPSIYGIATGLPVLIFAFVIAFSAGSLGKLFNKMTLIEKWMRRITGIIFIAVGIYYSLIYILGMMI